MNIGIQREKYANNKCYKSSKIFMRPTTSIPLSVVFRLEMRRTRVIPHIEYILSFVDELILKTFWIEHKNPKRKCTHNKHYESYEIFIRPTMSITLLVVFRLRTRRVRVIPHREYTLRFGDKPIP